MEETEESSENFEIVKRKIAVVDKLLRNKEKLEQAKSDLTTENLLKDSLIADLKKEVSEIRASLEKKNAKTQSLEADKRNLSLQTGKLQAALAKKDCDLINKELEINDLKRSLENAESEKEVLEDKIKHDTAIKKVREEYEAEKWKNLASISNFKQQVAALKDAVKEKEDEANAMKIDFKEFEQLKRDYIVLKKELNDNKKDRQIQSLARKLEKAHTELRKYSKCSNETVNMAKVEGTPPKHTSFKIIPTTKDHRRFPIFAKRKPIRTTRKFNFLKCGGLHFENIPMVLNRKPQISDSNPVVDQGDPEAVEMVPDKKAELATKRKAERPPVSPRKRWKGQTDERTPKSLQLPMNSSPKISVREDLMSLRKDQVSEKSQSRIQPLSTPQQAQSFSEQPRLAYDSDESNSSDEAGPLSISTPLRITKTPLVAPLPDEKQKASNFGVSLHPSKPETIVEDGVANSYYNPNPPKSRIAHKRSDKDVSSKFPIKPIPPPQSSKPLPKVKEKKPAAISKVLVPPTKTGRADSGTGAGNTARARLLETGLSIETPSSIAKNLTDAQIAAAKNRMVGRAPPGVATRPSKDGFRSSEPIANKSQRTVKPEEQVQKTSSSHVKQKPKATDFSCPSRRRTMPSRIALNRGSINSQNNSIPETADPLAQQENDCSPNISPQPEPALPENLDKRAGEAEGEAEENKTHDSVRTSLDEDLDLSDDSEVEPDDVVGVQAAKKVVEAEKSRSPGQETNEKPPAESSDSSSCVTGESPKKVGAEYSQGDTENPSSNPMDLLQSPSATVVDRIQYRNLLDELLDHFKRKQRRTKKQLEVTRTRVAEDRASFGYETFKGILVKNVSLVLKATTEAEFRQICDELCHGENVELHRRMFCDYIYNLLMTEHKSVKLLSDLNVNSPPVTRNQQRIFTLFTQLNERKEFSGVIVQFLDLLYYGFFGLDRMFNMNMSSLLSLSRLLVLCARHIDDLDCMKRFVWDLLFFKSPRIHLLIGVIIDLWPEVLGKVEDLSPEEETVLWAIFHAHDHKNSPEMRISETRLEIQIRYGYNPYDFEAKKLVIKYLDVVQKMPSKQVLESIKYSLVMLGRGNDYRWVNNHIVSRLLKFMDQVWADGNKNQKLIQWVIESLGLVSRLYPAEGRQQLTDLFESVKGLLTVQEKLDCETIESCVSAILHLGFHLQAQVSLFLVEWTPSCQLSENIKQKMQDFVGTRGLKHAEITSSVERNKENKKLKQRGGHHGRLGGRTRGGGGAAGRGRGGPRTRGGGGGGQSIASQ